MFWTSNQEAPLIHSADQSQKSCFTLRTEAAKLTNTAPLPPPQPTCSFAPALFLPAAAVPWLGSDREMLKREFEELLSFASAKPPRWGWHEPFLPPLVLQIPVPD